MALYTTYHNKEHCFKETMHTGKANMLFWPSNMKD